MSRELFGIWAPEGEEWTQWAKPAPFVGTSMGVAHQAYDGPIANTERITPAPDLAIVLDLPGPEAIKSGVMLAQNGRRPVPLINTTPGRDAAIDMASIMTAFRAGAAVLRELTIAPDAPPAFVLDSRRNAPTYSPRPNTYDNRWLVFPQDFPSGNYMFARGIRRAMVITRQQAIADDLLHVLRRWQDAGVKILLEHPQDGAPPVELTVAKPSRFKATWYRLMVAAGLRKNSAGGFGGYIPQPSESSGRSGFG